MEWNRLCIWLPTPVKPMSKFNTLKQCTFIISHINALAEWFLWLWLRFTRGTFVVRGWLWFGSVDLGWMWSLLGCSGQLVPWDSSTWSLHLQLSQASHWAEMVPGGRMEVPRGLLKPRLQINTTDFCQASHKSAQISWGPSSISCWRSFRSHCKGHAEIKKEKWGHFSNQSAGFPAEKLSLLLVWTFLLPSFHPAPQSNFYSLNFLIALVVELNQLSVPASVCWNSKSLVTSWWVRLWSTWALPRCLIFSFVSGVAEVRSDAISFHNFLCISSSYFGCAGLGAVQALLWLWSVGFSLQWPLSSSMGS